jgi:hypothetical protein
MDTIYMTIPALIVGSALLTRLAYPWILPKPIPGIPHNPVVSVLGDIPAIRQAGKEGSGLFSDFVANTVGVHGPVSQVRPMFATHKRGTANLGTPVLA